MFNHPCIPFICNRFIYHTVCRYSQYSFFFPFPYISWTQTPGPPSDVNFYPTSSFRETIRYKLVSKLPPFLHRFVKDSFCTEVRLLLTFSGLHFHRDLTSSFLFQSHRLISLAPLPVNLYFGVFIVPSLTHPGHVVTFPRSKGTRFAYRFPPKLSLHRTRINKSDETDDTILVKYPPSYLRSFG